MGSVSFVYITAPNLKEAKRLSRILLKERLAACVNILDSMKSIYWWKGKLEQSREVVVIVKTRKSLVTKLIKRIEQIHPYETPCALTLEVKKGSRAYMNWLLQETSRDRI